MATKKSKKKIDEPKETVIENQENDNLPDPPGYPNVVLFLPIIERCFRRSIESFIESQLKPDIVRSVFGHETDSSTPNLDLSKIEEKLRNLRVGGLLISECLVKVDEIIETIKKTVE